MEICGQPAGSDKRSADVAGFSVALGYALGRYTLEGPIAAETALAAPPALGSMVALAILWIAGRSVAARTDVSFHPVPQRKRPELPPRPASTYPAESNTFRRHHFARSTCSNSSSTGVARPKMETPTFTRPRSKSSSSTRPLKEANGPSSTLTLSPIS